MQILRSHITNYESKVNEINPLQLQEYSLEQSIYSYTLAISFSQWPNGKRKGENWEKVHEGIYQVLVYTKCKPSSPFQRSVCSLLYQSTLLGSAKFCQTKKIQLVECFDDFLGQFTGYWGKNPLEDLASLQCQFFKQIYSNPHSFSLDLKYS